MAHPLERATLSNHYDLEVILVRHGQQIPSAERKTPEQLADPPLTPLGERQIEVVGDHLGGEDIDMVFASPIIRARRTGEAIAARHGLEPVIIDDLREIESMRNLPEGKKPGEVIDPVIWKGAGERFVQTGNWEEFPLSERSADFHLRIGRAIEGAIATQPTGKIVIACHGGVINGYIAQHLGIDRDFWFRAAHCSVHRMHALGERRVVWNLNEIHHLSAADVLSV